jgi:cob(I)alamin adenosyltransferase
MQIETPPTEKRYDKPEGERGLVIVNTGDGKGKSTAAFGLAARAWARQGRQGLPVHEGAQARFGEHRMFEQIGLPIEGLGDGFSWKSKDLEHSAQLARDGWAKARADILRASTFWWCSTKPTR